MTVTPFDYLESRDDADEMIQEFGQVVKIPRQTRTGGTDWAPIFSTVYHDTFGARIDFTWKQMQTMDVQTNDQRFLIAAGPLAALGITAITNSDKVSVNGVDIPLISVVTIAPAGTVVMFDCQLRF